MSINDQAAVEHGEATYDEVPVAVTLHVTAHTPGLGQLVDVAWNAAHDCDGAEKAVWADYHAQLEAMSSGTTPAMARQGEIVYDGVTEFARRVPVPAGVDPSLRHPPAVEAGEWLGGAYGEALRGCAYDPEELKRFRGVFFAHCRYIDPEKATRLERDLDRADALLGAFHDEHEGGQR